jgi:hypothetical protein
MAEELCCCGGLLGRFVWIAAGRYCSVACLRSGLQQPDDFWHGSLNLICRLGCDVENAQKDPVSELPDWQRFLTTMLLKRIANLGPAGGPSYLELPEDEQQQKVNCLVCWSFDPLELPCHRQHTICIGCLDRFREEDNNCCPVCRLPLYKMQGDKRTSYKVIIACLCIFCAFNIIVIALKIYRGLFHHGPFDTLLFLPTTRAMWLYFKSPRGVNERFLASWHAVTLELWETGLMLLAFLTGNCVGVWDQVTFVDGELGHGLWIGMEYQFVWDH